MNVSYWVMTRVLKGLADHGGKSSSAFGHESRFCAYFYSPDSSNRSKFIYHFQNMIEVRPFRLARHQRT